MNRNKAKKKTILHDSFCAMYRTHLLIIAACILLYSQISVKII